MTRGTTTRSGRPALRAALAATALAVALGTVTATAASAVIPGTTPAGPTPRVEPNAREFALTALSLLPESVVYDEKTRSVYASSQNGGAITKLTYPQGQASVFLPPGVDAAGTPDMRTEAVGMALDTKRRLYVAGGKGGRLHVYDLDTRRSVAQFDTGLTGFLNDVTVNPANGDVYVTDSFQPTIYRFTAAQVAAGKGTPEKITISPEVTSLPVGSNPPKPFNANGLRFTPDNKYLLFDDLNDSALYRMTVPPAGRPAQRQITKVAVSGGSLGDADGLEFNGSTLYVADNGGERILNLALSADYTKATITKATTTPTFRTPTGMALVPNGQLIVANSRLFDPVAPPPFTVVGIPRP